MEFSVLQFPSFRRMSFFNICAACAMKDEEVNDSLCYLGRDVSLTNANFRFRRILCLIGLKSNERGEVVGFDEFLESR